MRSIVHTVTPAPTPKTPRAARNVLYDNEISGNSEYEIQSCKETFLSTLHHQLRQ